MAAASWQPSTKLLAMPPQENGEVLVAISLLRGSLSQG